MFTFSCTKKNKINQKYKLNSVSKQKLFDREILDLKF